MWLIFVSVRVKEYNIMAQCYQSRQVSMTIEPVSIGLPTAANCG
jgi:hypothetical protein